MSNFENLPEDEQTFILDQIHARTLLPNEAIKALLDAGWSYTQHEGGHAWTLSALEDQTVATQATDLVIPEVLLPPHGIPVNSNAIQQVHDAIRLPEGKEGTIEHAILMATLRSVYQGYKKREEKLAAEQAAEEASSGE
jgi:hypothetical protein